MDAFLAQARTFFLEGLEHYQAGRLQLAEHKFAAALALAPGRPSVLTNLGAVRLKLGRARDALELLQEAAAKEPDNAEALGYCGVALAELGDPAHALPMLERALAVDASKGALWRLRGSVLVELGRPDDAAQSFREALVRGEDPELVGYYLAGLGAGEAPSHAPPGYVAALFDGYAEQFDRQLVDALRYDAPQVLGARIAASGRRFAHALDLGCGTGLCGRHLRPMADRVTGVDLSARMLQKAQATGSYDVLSRAEVRQFLAGTQESFDLVVAADVFIYVGALDEVFAQVAQHMPVGGVFAFTVEDSGGPELQLRASLRYAHSEEGIRRLAQANGFRVDHLARRPLRQEQEAAVAGLFVWLEKA